MKRYSLWSVYNKYMIRKATKGLAKYLLYNKANATEQGVVIAYDSRMFSRNFAIVAAMTLCEMGIKVFLFEELEPTSVLPFAVRDLNAIAGIVITASHNPKEYNGYKVYDSEGCQILPEEAAKISAEIRAVDTYLDRIELSIEEAESSKLLQWIGEEVEDRFLAVIMKDRGKSESRGLSVVYTLLNGTGNRPVRKALASIGVDKLFVVKEQEMPDGNFSTVRVPNSEEKDALELGNRLVKEKKADIVFGTDPDCDRIGVAVLHNGEYVLLSGNQIGALLVHDILEQKKHILHDDSFIVKTIVTSDLGAKIVGSFGVKAKEVLTGFKYIGALVNDVFVFGYEESFGYLAGQHARDKDAVVSSVLICEMVERYKKKGMTLLDALEQLYKQHGF